MPESLVGADHVELGTDDYFADFWERLGHLDGGLWKLERRQEFREPGYPSWDAFAAGRIEDSLDLAEAGRAEIIDYQRRLSARLIESRRVRVAASPPTPYLWWESHILKIRAEAGEQIRVVGAASVTSHEVAGPLPEIVILGSGVLYDVRYDAGGVITGAHRYAQSELIASWLGFIAELFDAGEAFLEYFTREIGPSPDGDKPGTPS